MRKAVSVLVVAAVLVVAGLAAADAVRGRGESQAQEPAPTAPTATRPTGLEGKLAARGVGGTLVFTRKAGSGGGCEVFTVSLPSPAARGPLPIRGCRLTVSQLGGIAVGPPCPDGHIELVTDLRDVFRLRGCAPAWRPDGTFTFVRDGVIHRLPRYCPGGRQGCIPALGSARRLVERVGAGARLREMAWPANDRIALLAATHGGYPRTLAFFHGGRLVRRAHASCGLQHLEGRPGEVSVRGLVGGGSCALVEYGVSGKPSRRLGAPGFLADGRAVALSPDGRWLATTVRDTVQIYRAGLGSPRDAIELPVRAVDLAWTR